MHITAIRLDRLTLPLDPPFRGRLGPGAAALVRAPRSSGSRPTRAWSASAPATRWTGSPPTSTCSSARTRCAIARHVRSLETIDFHAGRYWPLEAALWDIVGQVAGLPVATLFGGATDGMPGLRVVRRAQGPGRARRVRPPAARRGLPGAQDPDRPAPPRRGPRGRPARPGTPSATSMAIMVDLNQGWRMAGDIGPALDPAAARSIAAELRRARRPVARGAARRDATCAASPTCARTSRRPDRRRRDDPDDGRAAWPRSTPTPSTSTSRTSSWPSGCSGRGPSPSSPWRATAGSPRTPGPTGSACSPTSTSRPASAAGRSSSIPYDPPGWTPERRDFMLAEPLRPGPDGILRVPRPAGPRDRPRRSGRAAVRGMTVDAAPADPAPSRSTTGVARARDLRPHAQAVHRRPAPCRPPPGRTFADVTGRDGSTIAEVAEGGEEDVDRAVAAARAAFDDGRWSDLAPADRKRLLLRFAELMRGRPASTSRCVEALDCGKPIRDTLARRRRRAAGRHPVVRRGDRQALRRGRADRAGDARRS